ncbi:MAG: hypothetical protein CMF62_03650 [Magnetococcales bacterium]|nr:hypothetical protein [Magnetococcales bacterium]|tara:strand:+ start:19558 stop:20637 length:1080 start_codon:yes stop_codon:yes gene_type:complete
MLNDIVISIDTSKSMKPFIHQLKNDREYFIKSLTSKSKKNKISIILHGDYDSSNYLIKKLELTNDYDTILKFLENINSSGDELPNDGQAYEIALNECNKLNWRLKSNKLLIIIGNDAPHSINYCDNINKVDWKKELDNLFQKNVKVYGIQVNNNNISRAEYFFKKLNKIELKNNNLLVENYVNLKYIIIAVFYSAMYKTKFKINKFENELIRDNQFNRNLELNFNTLLKRKDKQLYSISNESYDLELVKSNRFQLLDNNETITIKNFINKLGIKFQKGRGFYELTKRENVSLKKEIILMDKKTGNFFTGTKAKQILNINEETKYIKPDNVPKDYLAFIQSTSYTRKLIPYAKFLYEIDL